ncbi:MULTISPECIES: glutaredoxin domain-containing protein [Bacillus]|nr:glutaredoxin domain-containing protein [Bacillus rhizoplanae]
MRNTQLELYTRPTCSDCKAAKEFLSENMISVSNHLKKKN